MSDLFALDPDDVDIELGKPLSKAVLLKSFTVGGTTFPIEPPVYLPRHAVIDLVERDMKASIEESEDGRSFFIKLSKPDH